MLETPVWTSTSRYLWKDAHSHMINISFDGKEVYEFHVIAENLLNFYDKLIDTKVVENGFG